MKMKLLTFIIVSLSLLLGISAEQCGRQAGGATCPNGLCCIKFGWCGSTAEHCGGSTPSPTPSGGGGDVSNLVSSSLFDQMLKYRNDARCKGNGFYKYDAFIAAARSFPGFGTTGDDAMGKRKITAFLAQTFHETTGVGEFLYVWLFIGRVSFDWNISDSLYGRKGGITSSGSVMDFLRDPKPWPEEMVRTYEELC
ncbi:putative chitinase [Rosa chinensis]|uniref:chitinase n=1 Tax=Rosa chinensis TaxID=74649 RepID=A0A2P6RLE9_ROSCH|nr:putative chitinase [Rosa chinensis]